MSGVGYLADQWFIACPTHALRRRPRACIIQDVPLVLFRERGLDVRRRCSIRRPHRNVPLSAGRVDEWAARMRLPRLAVRRRRRVSPDPCALTGDADRKGTTCDVVCRARAGRLRVGVLDAGRRAGARAVPVPVGRRGLRHDPPRHPLARVPCATPSRTRSTCRTRSFLHGRTLPDRRTAQRHRGDRSSSVRTAWRRSSSASHGRPASSGACSPRAEASSSTSIASSCRRWRRWSIAWATREPSPQYRLHDARVGRSRPMSGR